MDIEFYDVRRRKKLYVDEQYVAKTVQTAGNGEPRYAFITKTDDGRNLTKYVSKDRWEALQIPVRSR